MRRLVLVLAGILVAAGFAAGCGDDDDDSTGAAVGELCGGDTACAGAAVCADTGVRCAEVSCPSWRCYEPCLDDGDCASGTCETEARDLAGGSGDVARVCALE